EVFRRDLALQRGYSSIVHYARAELGLTDAMAWDRIRAARLALDLPETIEQIASAKLTLAAAGELWRTIEENAQRTPPNKNLDRRKDSALQPGLALSPSSAAAYQATAAAPAPKPIAKDEKKELLQTVLGKTRYESQVTLREWKQEREGI